jgi:hypothetical protein
METLWSTNLNFLQSYPFQKTFVDLWFRASQDAPLHQRGEWMNRFRVLSTRKEGVLLDMQPAVAAAEGHLYSKTANVVLRTLMWEGIISVIAICTLQATHPLYLHAPLYLFSEEPVARFTSTPLLSLLFGTQRNQRTPAPMLLWSFLEPFSSPGGIVCVH